MGVSVNYIGFAAMLHSSLCPAHNGAVHPSKHGDPCLFFPEKKEKGEEKVHRRRIPGSYPLFFGEQGSSQPHEVFDGGATSFAETVPRLFLSSGIVQCHCGALKGELLPVINPVTTLEKVLYLLPVNEVKRTRYLSKFGNVFKHLVLGKTGSI